MEFQKFELTSGQFLGTMSDGAVVPVESIVYRGDLGETHITYTRDGEERVAIRQRNPYAERTY